ncbi:MAG: flagellar biosynthetic protein FliR [Acidimicrobiales bacterium]
MLRLPVDPVAILGFVLAFVRASAWLVICPPFNTKSIPAMAKVGIAAGLALAAAGHLGAGVGSGGVPASTAGFVGAVATQAVTGAALGFIVLVLLSAVEAAGNLIGLFGGFALPPSLDPLSLNASPALGQLYELLAVTLLFAMGGELLLAKGFVSSFGAIGWTLHSAGPLAEILTHDVATFFTSALEIAAPLLVVLFLAQVVLGVLSKAAPQMNVFAYAFPFEILLTLVLVVLGVAVLPGYVSQILQRGLSDSNAWLRVSG